MLQDFDENNYSTVTMKANLSDWLMTCAHSHEETIIYVVIWSYQNVKKAPKKFHVFETHYV